MADIDKTMAVKNGSVVFTPVAGAASQTIPVSKDERMVIYVNNGGSTAITATVKAGNGICSVQGDFTVSIGAGDIAIIGPLESARFGNNSVMELDLSATASITVGVIQL